MKPLAAVFLALALAACAEVTKFENADGTAFYYVDCENSLRLLETCGFAARRTCPNGYYPVKAASLSSAIEDRPYARCLEENRDRKEAGEPLATCVPKRHNEGFFACK